MFERTTALEKAFPAREMFRGAGLVSLIWSVCGSIMLIVLLCNLALIADLMVVRGELTLRTAEEVATLRQLIGDVLPLPPVDDESGELLAPVRFDDAGILPAVWRIRNSPGGQLAASIYARAAWLREDVEALLTLVMSTLVFGFIRLMCLSRARTAAWKSAMDAVIGLRKMLHRQVLRLGPSDLEGRDGVHALELFTVDMDQIREGSFFWLSRLGRFPVELALLSISALSVHWLLALQCAFPLGASWFLIQRQRKRFDRQRRLDESRMESQMRLLAESLRKTRIVRGYGMENFEHEQFQRYLDRFRKNIARLKYGETFERWTSRMLAVICLAIVLYLVGSKVLQTPDDLSVAGAVLLLSYFACMYRPLEQLRLLESEQDAAKLAAARVQRFLARVPEVGQAVGAKFLEPLSRTLRFESINYALPHSRRKVLDAFEMEIPAGQVVALVSLDPTAARAVSHLCPRFIEPQAGRVLYDGEDISWATLESLRAETIYVGGDDPMFTGSVLENISCGDAEYSLQDVTEAAKRTHAHNFVVKLPSGYETVLGEHGDQLDAGEAFRISLSRAILRDPAVLIVEEPNAPLDTDTKSLLDDAYNRIFRDRTVLLLPSRLSTLRRADRVVFIVDGKIDSDGEYQQIVKGSATYRHWEYLRFNEYSAQTTT